MDAFEWSWAAVSEDGSKWGGLCRGADGVTALDGLRDVARSLRWVRIVVTRRVRLGG